MLYVCIVLLLCVNRILLENVKSSRNVAIKEMNDVSIGDLVFNLQPEQKRIVRAIERTQKQYTNSKYAVIFNTTHIYIYIYISISKHEQNNFNRTTNTPVMSHSIGHMKGQLKDDQRLLSDCKNNGIIQILK